MRGVPRIALTGVAVVLAVAGLTGCRTSPTVAAYVGDETITVQELESAVDVRLRNDSVAAFAAKDQDAFTRQVLSVLVRREVHAAAVKHYGVDEVTDREALDYLTSLLGGTSLEQQLAQAAGQGLARGDVIELARDRVIEAEVAEATGKSERPVESVLRARYDKDPAQYTVY